MTSVLSMIAFWLVLITGVVIIPFGVAGTFIIVAAALVYGLLTHFAELSIGFIAVLLSMAVGMEILEAIFGALLAKKFGGSKWGMIGAMVGGGAGAIIGTPVTPVIGTLSGGFLGSFLGAMLFEFMHEQNAHLAFQVGLGAFFGAIGGKVTKIIVAILMVVMIGIRVF